MDGQSAAAEGDDEVMRWRETKDPFSLPGYNPAMFVEPDDSIEKVFEKVSSQDLGREAQADLCVAVPFCGRRSQPRERVCEG